MSLYVLALVLVASLTHAFWNYLAKKTNGKLPFIWLIYIVSSVLYVPVLLYQISLGNIIYSATLVLFSLVSAIVHLVYFIVLQTGYRKADLSVVYPLARGSGPLFSSVAAILLLGEQTSFYASLGLVLIVAGVLVITKFSFKISKDERLKKGLIYGLATGLLIALYTVVDNIAVKQYAISPFIITFASNIFGSVVLLPLVWREKAEVSREIKEHRWSILAIAVLSPVAYILILIALKFTALIIIAPARELSILFGVFMGSQFMNEQEVKRRVIASVLILAGIVCLAIH